MWKTKGQGGKMSPNEVLMGLTLLPGDSMKAHKGFPEGKPETAKPRGAVYHNLS